MAADDSHSLCNDSSPSHSAESTKLEGIDTEKEDRRSAADERHYQPISSPVSAGRALEALSLTDTLSRTRSSQSCRSVCDGHGFAFVASEGEAENGEGADVAVPEQNEKEWEVSWKGEDDAEDPKNMCTFRKWVITMLISFASLCVTCTSSAYTSTYDQIEKEFSISREVATIGLSLFVMGLGVGPLFLSPLSEFYGRRIIYLVSFSLFFIWLIPCALAQNIATMLIARFLNGVCGSAFLSVAGGTIGDIFDRDHLGFPMLIYSGSPFLGPELGPILAGFINYYTTWRWTFYMLLIWTGVLLLGIVFFVPETYRPVLLRRRAQKLRKETGDDRWMAPIEKMHRSVLQTVWISCYRPFQLLLLEPMCLNLCIFSAIVLGILYLFFGAFALVFENNYGFNLWQVGLSFLGLTVGMFVGLATNPIFERNYQRLIRRHEQVTGEVGGSEPEYRLPPAVVGGCLIPIGMFWFGWTTYPSVHYIVPIIGSAFFSIGFLLLYSGIFTFLVDAYPLYAASALAANSFARSSFAAAFPLFGLQMYEKLGYQWATSLLAFLTLAMAPFPYIFYRYGKRIRGKSRFATDK